MKGSCGHCGYRQFQIHTRKLVKRKCGGDFYKLEIMDCRKQRDKVVETRPLPFLDAASSKKYLVVKQHSKCWSIWRAIITEM